MEIGDFAAFLYAPILSVSLAAIYLSLKSLSWELHGRLFLDAWLIWLVWAASGVFSYVMLWLLVPNKIYWGFPTFLWILISMGAALVSNIIAIGIFVRLIRMFRSRNNVGLFEATDPQPQGITSSLRISLITSIAATVTFGFLLGLFLITIDIYERYYPPKFGIYDI